MTEKEIYEKYEEIWKFFLNVIGVESKKWYWSDVEGNVYVYWLKDDCDQDYRIYLQEKLEKWITASTAFCEEEFCKGNIDLYDFFCEESDNLYNYLECALSYEHEGLKELILTVRDLWENDLFSELDEAGFLDGWKIYSN